MSSRLPNRIPLLIVLFILFVLCSVYFLLVPRQSATAKPQPREGNDEKVYPPTKMTAVEEAAYWRNRGPLKNSTVKVVPYHRLYDYHMISRKYNLVSCVILKNMATVMMSTFCYLRNTTEYFEHNKTISQVWWRDSLCIGIGERLDSQQYTQMLANGTKFFTVVRHPVDRFISGFVDKCYNELVWFDEDERCFGCYNDVRCFMETMFRILVEGSTGIIGRFTAMSNYYILHFAPQTWNCNLRQFKKDFTLVTFHRGVNATQRTVAEFDQVFASANVPDEERAYIRSEMLKGTAKHSTHGSAAVREVTLRIQNDPYLQDLLMRMYYYDFVELGFL